MISLVGAIGAADAWMQAQTIEQFQKAEEGNEKLEKITTLLQKVNRLTEDGKIDLVNIDPEDAEKLQKVEEFQNLLAEVREFADDLIDGDITVLDGIDLEGFKQNINHEIKKIEGNIKLTADIAIHKLSEHKNIYESLLETSKRLSQMFDSMTRIGAAR